MTTGQPPEKQPTIPGITDDDRYRVSPWIPLEHAKIWLNRQPEDYRLTQVIRGDGGFLAFVMIKVPPGAPIQVLPPILF